MTRHLFIFLGTFLAGAVIALAARSAWFDPNADHTGHPVAGGDYAPMVTNQPAAESKSAPSTQSAPADHSGHNATGVATVNTVCAICGMDVDPDLPTATYEGKTVGFGCKACPPRFKANPEKYGPAALRNEVVKN